VEHTDAKGVLCYSHPATAETTLTRPVAPPLPPPRESFAAFLAQVGSARAPNSFVAGHKLRPFQPNNFNGALGYFFFK
jgi:hypothetical protein